LAVSALGATNIALVGGISGAISPYLSQNSKFDIVKPERDPIDGAIMLAGGNIA
jgi:glucosamine kinase